MPYNGPAPLHGGDGEGSGRCRGWDGAGDAMEPRHSGAMGRRRSGEEAVGSCYLIVQGYGEVPAGALHLVLGTLLL